MYVHIYLFTFLIMYHWACDWISSQVANVLVVGPVQLLLFRGFQVGVYFLLVGCPLLWPCVFADCVLNCNLRTQISLTVPTAWSTDIYIYIYIYS